MTIAGQTFAVHQAETGCSYSITPTSATGDPAGGSGTVHVTADAGCDWTSTSDSPWLWFAWGSGYGTGSGTADYGYSRNTGPARTGALTIAGRRFTLSQPAAACDNTGSSTRTAP